MKILSIKEDGDMIIVLTDNKSRDTFVYPKSRFKDLNLLKTELCKSLTLEGTRLKRDNDNFKKLVSSFDDEKLVFGDSNV